MDENFVSMVGRISQYIGEAPAHIYHWGGNAYCNWLTDKGTTETQGAIDAAYLGNGKVWLSHHVTRHIKPDLRSKFAAAAFRSGFALSMDKTDFLIP